MSNHFIRNTYETAGLGGVMYTAGDLSEFTGGELLSNWTEGSLNFSLNPLNIDGPSPYYGRDTYQDFQVSAPASGASSYAWCVTFNTAVFPWAAVEGVLGACP